MTVALMKVFGVPEFPSLMITLGETNANLLRL
ncbi:hypothetical protein AmaxDRAFT_3127 [Limnospira maxima CS-328]|uniref:Uncharacterized protein n=1 Tax=Limnospira maxima CS-328 TaxID=513049 RepID=B5W2X5_LIMMA|nr:hypothetical protein AmaxDRAFT_3127 [Limnospira maxima CS-328]UWU46144.1 hypothetical protein APLC1_0837 [Arthrospira platensis C1]